LTEGVAWQVEGEEDDDDEEGEDDDNDEEEDDDNDEEGNLVKHECLCSSLSVVDVPLRLSLSLAVSEIVLSPAQQVGMDLKDDGGEMEIEEDYEGEDSTTGDGEDKVGWSGGVAARGRLTEGVASQGKEEEDDDDEDGDEEDDDNDDEEGNPVKHGCLCVRVYQSSMFICVRISRVLFLCHSRPRPRADASSLLRHPEDLQSSVRCAQGAALGCPMDGEAEHVDLLHASDCKV
jgi:hypothetical protein